MLLLLQISLWGRKDPLEEDGHPLQCSGLENPMDRGAWRATVHGLQSRTRLKQLTAHTHTSFHTRKKAHARRPVTSHLTHVPAAGQPRPAATAPMFEPSNRFCFSPITHSPTLLFYLHPVADLSTPGAQHERQTPSPGGHARSGEADNDTVQPNPFFPSKSLEGHHFYNLNLPGFAVDAVQQNTKVNHCSMWGFSLYK